MVANLITLYESTESAFTSNGLGNLGEAVSCEVYEERNGEFELTMEYPITGRHYSEIQLRRIILAKPNPYAPAQPFRIYSITKPIQGIITVSAHHVSYDLSGYLLYPFADKTLPQVFEEINRQLSNPGNNPENKAVFHFSTDKTDASGQMSLLTPCNIRSLLGGTEGSILDRWPGEYEWDRYNVIYHKSRGKDRGVTIQYGRNLTDLNQEEKGENLWTSVFPYYYTEENGYIGGTGLVYVKTAEDDPSRNYYNYNQTYLLDCTSDFEDVPTQAQLMDRAREYIKNNSLDVPSVSLTVSFVALSDITNRSDAYRILEQITLCDTVRIYFDRLGVSATAMCISTRYNVLTGKYIEIELGNARSNLASTISDLPGEILKNLPEDQTGFIEKAIKEQTALITGNQGGYVVLYDKNGDSKPDEILVMDTDDIKTTVNIWRFNSAGIGHSSTGYNGVYTTAWTMDGQMNASLATFGEMSANRIRGGWLTIGGDSSEFGKIDVWGSNPVESIGSIDEYGFSLNRTRSAGENKGSLSISTGVYKLYSSGNVEEQSRASITNSYFILNSWLYTDSSPRTTKISAYYEISMELTSYGSGSDLSSAYTVSHDMRRIRNFNISLYSPFGAQNGPGVILEALASSSSMADAMVRIYPKTYFVNGLQQVISLANYAQRSVSTYNTTTQLSGDIGSGVIDETGKCYVSIDDIFSEAVNTSIEYYVFLQKEGPGDIWVSEKKPGYFVVEGTPNLPFSWELKARINGSENERMEIISLDDNGIRYGEPIATGFEEDMKKMDEDYTKLEDTYEAEYQELFTERGGIIR